MGKASGLSRALGTAIPFVPACRPVCGNGNSRRKGVAYPITCPPTAVAIRPPKKALIEVVCRLPPRLGIGKPRLVGFRFQLLGGRYSGVPLH